MSKYPLLGMTLAELQSVVRGLGMPGFAAKQIASWLYDKKVATIDEMTNLSLKHREALRADYEVGGEAPVDAMHSVDGTIKYLYRVGERIISWKQCIFRMTTVLLFVSLHRWGVK